MNQKHEIRIILRNNVFDNCDDLKICIGKFSTRMIFNYMMLFGLVTLNVNLVLFNIAGKKVVVYEQFTLKLCLTRSLRRCR